MKSLTILIFFIPVLLFAQSPVDQAKSLYDSKKYDEAKKILFKVPEGNKDYGAARFYLGRIAFDQKEYDDATDYFEEAIEVNDKVAEYHYWLGSTFGSIATNANVLKQGMMASKIKDEFEKTVALDPRHLDAYWGLIQFYTAAPGFMGGSVDKALEQAAAIRKINEADGHRAYGMVYNKQEKFTEAEKEYILAFKGNSTYISPIISFYIGRKENGKAFTFLEDAIKAQPDNMLLVYQMGRTSAITGEKLDRGEESLIKYLTYQPKPTEPAHAGAQMRLGQISEKRGNKTEAKKRYEASLKLDPSQKDAKEGLTRVSK
ncbi:MAG TPA: tetratricopeptide repeat protein [Cyclobacteriaceae bacterium]|nr:tetratricopeptide repeat protein [Cyclobacteriaceae bacterium]